jgi:hypothetical protein
MALTTDSQIDNGGSGLDSIQDLSNNLKIVCVNIQCLRTKFNLVSLFVDNVCPDILCLSEHHLMHSEFDYYRSISNLNLAAIYARTHHRNGGAAIYVRDNLDFKQIDVHQFCDEFDIELACIEISDLSIIVVSVYRAPSGCLEKFFEALDRCLVFLSRRGKRLILGGDVNVHLQGEGNTYSFFKYLLHSHGMYITNREPTRGSSCLDTIATSLDAWEYVVSVIDPVIADHDAVVMELRLKLVSGSSSEQSDMGQMSYRNISESQLPLFGVALDGVDWSRVLDCGQPEMAFNAFFSTFMDIFDRLFPARVRSFRRPARNCRKFDMGRNDKSWYTPRLAQMRSLIIALHDRIRLCVGEDDRRYFYNQYLEARSIYRAEIDTAKRSANMARIVSAGNPCKAAWDLVNQIAKARTRPKCKATPDEFNSFFIGEVNRIVESVRDEGVYAPSRHDIPLNFLRWKWVKPDDVVRVIRGFKNSCSPDIFGVTVVVLKHVADVIAVPLSHVLNVCLSEGYFPDVLKLSRTIPVFKKGDPESMNNYRPISIIPVLGKVFEALMREQLVCHFENNRLFSNAQHGFRRGRSTVTAVTQMIDYIIEAFEERSFVHLILADLSKAFDCVPHGVLLKKLEVYGVGGSVLLTLGSYLSGRMQIVSVGGAFSQPLPVEHGVPQGSVLGPLLFLIMINDLGLLGPMLMFADDTTVYSKGGTLELAGAEAHGVFDRAKQWFQRNRLCLNEGKTQQMICGLRSLADSTHPLEVKLLGFVIDSRLTWTSHIDSVCTRLARVIYLLRRLRTLLSRKDLVTIYFGLFHTHVLYGLLLWGHAAGCRSVLKLQKRALRVITSAGYRDHCRPIFVSLGILTVFNQYILSSLLHVKNTEDSLARRSDLHSHSTRRRDMIDIPRCRTSKKKDSFPILALRLFNALPENVRSLHGGAFRTKLESWLRKNPFYSLDEYFEADRVTIV